MLTKQALIKSSNQNITDTATIFLVSNPKEHPLYDC